MVLPRLRYRAEALNHRHDLSYDTSIWYPVTSGGTTTWQPVNNWGWRGQTEVLLGFVSATVTHVSACNGQGSLYTASNWVYHDSLGATHPFSGTTQSQRGSLNCQRFDTSLTALALDSSGFTLNATGAFSLTATITSSAGAVTNPPINTTGGPASFTDRNGNQLTADSSGHFFDTLSSSTAALVVSGSGTVASPMNFTYTAPSGASAYYQVSYTTAIPMTPKTALSPSTVAPQPPISTMPKATESKRLSAPSPRRMSSVPTAKSFRKLTRT